MVNVNTSFEMHIHDENISSAIIYIIYTAIVPKCTHIFSTLAQSSWNVFVLACVSGGHIKSQRTFKNIVTSIKISFNLGDNLLVY